MRHWIFVLLAPLAVVAAAAVVAVAGAQTPEPACIAIRAAGDSGVYVNLANDANAETIAHVRAAVVAGQPRILHWDPADADVHRRQALRGVATAPGKDRDEYPPAASAEGGAGSDVRLIASADNRSSGSRMGAVMHPYCAGTPFILEP